MMLNRNSGSGHPCHVPRLKARVFSLSLLSMMLVQSFVLYQVQKWPAIPR